MPAVHVHLQPLDLVLILLYLVGITLFGLRFREKKSPQRQSLQSYFLAGNTIPWWAIALSIVSAETSTLTIISVPGVAYAGDFGFLQIVLGYMIGRLVVAALFLPRYFEGRMLTAYQLIDQRFGPILHKVTAGLFLLTRAAAEGVRVFAVSIVVSIAIGTGDLLSIALITALTLLYTFEGGLAAVIWTDVVQMAIYIAGTAIALLTLGHHVPGGWSTIHQIAGAAGKFHWLDFTLNLTTTYTFWAGILGGTFLTMASHGTDQLMVQRMLAARSLRESRLALLSSGVVIFIQFAFFLLIGAGLYVFYSLRPTPFAGGPAGLIPPDRLFPTFIVHEMPTGIAGLLIAAILAAAMSNLSAALNSLSSTAVVDFYLPWRNRQRMINQNKLSSFAEGGGPAFSTAAGNKELSSFREAGGPAFPTTTPEESPTQARQRTLLAKSSTVLWALILFAVAAYSLQAGGKGHVVEIALSIASVAYGALLGVFLLGTLTRYATQTGAILGMITGFIFNLILWLFPGKVLYQGDVVHGNNPGGVVSFDTVAHVTIPHIAFTWYVFLGAVVTFAVGSLASLLFRKQAVAALAVAVAFLVVIPEGNLLLAAQTNPKANPTPRNAALKLTASPTPSPTPQPASPTGTSTVTPTRNPLTGTPSATPSPNQPFASLKGTASAVPSPNLKTAALAAEVLFPVPVPNPQETPTYDFTPISTLINQSIADKKLPGAVVLIAHNNKVLFEQAYGLRKLAGEPSLDASLAPEPMTEDTIFDMASLTKCLATATAIMQLYEQGKLAFDDPIQKYLPAFNPANDPERAKVTIRDLLTHYSGEAPDVDLKDPWGLATPDKAEGLRRALTTSLKSPPGQTFVYSDINFLLLGDLVETLSGQPEDVFVAEHILTPLGMTQSQFRPFDKTCGPATRYGANVTPGPKPIGRILVQCLSHTWSPTLLDPQTAPTTHDDESKSDPTLNPNFDHLLRGTVHDPTSRRMGGVAGHAGLFSTAHDVGLYAQALLDKLTKNTGPFPLKQSTLKLMTTPQQPPTARADATIFTPDAQTTKGVATRGFGWDINSPFSRPRGSIFPIGSFGHTGFTGTSLWIDPISNTYVILLANAIHPRGNPPISTLRGQIATAAAHTLGLDRSIPDAPQATLKVVELIAAQTPTPTAATCAQHIGPGPVLCPTYTGIDILEQTRYQALQEAAQRHNNRLNLAILTNVAGVDSHGRRTIDIIATDAAKAVPQLHLTTLFAAEHGLSAKQDTTAISAETDTITHIPITSLYGPKPADRRPTHAQLANLDAVLIDLQDVGNRFWTFDTAMAYFLEASAEEQRLYHHDLEIIVLDHPNPTSGTDFAVQGPVSDPGRQSYVDYTPLPARHGLTIAELAQYFNAEATPTTANTAIFADIPAAHPSPTQPAERGIHAHLTVVPLQNWTRPQYLDQTGIPWIPPSPNLRTLTAATLYPGIGLFETSNLSVGRGTPTPFEHFGAPYLVPEALLACLTPRQIPGIRFDPTTLTIAETKDHYPYHGQTIPGIHLTITDRTTLNPPELAMEIITCVQKLYPTQFNLDRTNRIIANADTLARLQRGEDPQKIAASWQPALDSFRRRRAPYLLYP